MKPFIFRSYFFDETNKEAVFEYSYNNQHFFKEKIVFSQVSESYNKAVLDKALFLAFIVIGTSYYKAFPTNKIVFEMGELD